MPCWFTCLYLEDVFGILTAFQLSTSGPGNSINWVLGKMPLTAWAIGLPASLEQFMYNSLCNFMCNLGFQANYGLYSGVGPYPEKNPFHRWIPSNHSVLDQEKFEDPSEQVPLTSKCHCTTLKLLALATRCSRLLAVTVGSWGFYPVASHCFLHGIHSISCLPLLCSAFWTLCILIKTSASPDDPKTGAMRYGGSNPGSLALQKLVVVPGVVLCLWVGRAHL